MFSNQRGVIDPWTLGFLISLTGLFLTQPWDKVNKETLSDNTRIEQTQNEQPARKD